MVFVNSKKFACESCIKGHRSSSCHHTDRPLFEIKKKGRPVSQCTKCRELRQSKKLHSKCNCHPEKDATPAVQPLSATSISKTRRFIPIVPALPNGLRDVLDNSRSTVPADLRQRVNSLLNPCTCNSVWKCSCRNSEASGSSSSSTDALYTLARAAAMTRRPLLAEEEEEDEEEANADYQNDIGLQNKTLHSRPTTPSGVSNKRHKDDKIQGPDLAPIHYSPSTSSFFLRPTAVPDFPTMPPMSEMSSLAGTGCTCGMQCSCPGCVEHRGSLHANHDWKDCYDGCGTCVDPSLGTSLPQLSNPSHSGTSILDRFFARAAALPPPPVNRKVNIDPMDTSLYTDSVRAPGSNLFSFGTVNLPKLECCGGQCNCPDGRCTCRASCAGCCADAKEGTEAAENIVDTSAVNSTPLPPPIRSCCAGKS